MTLFDRLRDIAAYAEANPGSMFGDAEEVLSDSLPAVLNLIQTVLDVIDEDEHPGKRRHPTKLELAVAPFIEEEA